MENEKFWAECGFDKSDLAEVMCLFIKNKEITLEEVVEKTEMKEDSIKMALKGKGNNVFSMFGKFSTSFNLELKVHVSES